MGSGIPGWPEGFQKTSGLWWGSASLLSPKDASEACARQAFGIKGCGSVREKAAGNVWSQC